MTDEKGAVGKTSILIRADVDVVLPTARLVLSPSFPAEAGDTVQVNLLAESIADITDKLLFIDNVPIDLTASQAEFIPTQPGKVLVEAIVIDDDGLVGRTETFIKVRDPNDVEPPIIGFDPTINESQLTSSRDVSILVDDTNLDFWKLEIASYGTSDFTELASGDDPIDGSVANLNPSGTGKRFLYTSSSGA